MSGETWNSELLRRRVSNSVDLFGLIILLISNAGTGMWYALVRGTDSGTCLVENPIREDRY